MIFGIKDGRKITASPGEKASCPLCGGDLIPKCGEIISWHWSHYSILGCDTWSEGETEWHLHWKLVIADLSPKFVEVTVSDKSGQIKHRADVRYPHGQVVEFQHSSISVDEIREREFFYKDMIWVFDATEARKQERISIFKKQGYQTFRWKHARKSIAHCTKPVMLDLGTELLEVKKVHSGDRFCGWGFVIPKERFIEMLRAPIIAYLDTDPWGRSE